MGLFFEIAIPVLVSIAIITAVSAVTNKDMDGY